MRTLVLCCLLLCSSCTPDVSIPVTIEQRDYLLIRWRGQHKQAPRDVQEGDYYYNKTDDCIYYWHNGTWNRL
jgi:hypothetical protein